MTQKQAIDAVLAAAVAKNGVREIPRGSNRGKDVEMFLRVTGLGGGYPWCAAFVVWAIVTALGEACPVPRTADCDVLLFWAKRRGVLVETGGKRGDIGLLLRPGDPNDAHHAFFVVEDEDSDGIPNTIEGNTNRAGSREGDGVYERERPDTPRVVFVRWWKLFDDVVEVAERPLFAYTGDGSVPFATGIIRDGRVFVPIRALMERLFGELETNQSLAWNAVGNRPAWKDDPLPSSVPVWLSGGAAHVAVRPMATWLGLETVFDTERRTVRLIRPA